MMNTNWRRTIYFVCLITALGLVGCKKKVAAVPSTPPPVQPAPPLPPAPRPAENRAPAPTRAATTPGAPAAPARPAPRADDRPNVADLFRQNVQTIYFDFDKADIRPDQVSRLQADVAWLKEHPGIKFKIEGNCDERGSEEYNLALGDRRANRVKEFLVKEGVDSSTISTLSYGEERPVCRESSEDCYQKNRRAAFDPGS